MVVKGAIKIAKKKPLVFLVDADMLCYATASACEKDVDWGNDLVTVYTDLSEAKHSFQVMLKKTVKAAKKKLRCRRKHQEILCFSHTKNFRKMLLPTYKSNRTKRKPCGYYQLREWIEANYDVRCLPGLEADDVIGILSGDNTCIISADKDMRTLGGLFYHYQRDDLYDTSEAEAEYHWLYQALIGDSTDGYSGLPGCGPKGAEKILQKDCSWAAVVTAYESKGLTQEDALLQARMARILHKEDYDMDTGDVLLWTPPGASSCPRLQLS
jgi:5''-3'' exonuclease (including N-terminal domain of PolI)